MIPTPSPDVFDLGEAVVTAGSLFNAVNPTVLWVVGVGIGLVILGLIIRALREVF